MSEDRGLKAGNRKEERGKGEGKIGSKLNAERNKD